MKKIIFILTLLLSLNGFAQFPIPGTEGFESTTGPDVLPSTNWSLGTGNWAVFDNGVGLTQRWGINNGVASPPLVYAGTNAAYINRENIGLGNTSEDYLATPLVTVPANGQLRFFARTFSTGNTGTLYQVKVAPSTATQTNPAAYTTQLAEYNEDQLTLDMNGVQNAYNIYTEKVISFPASMIGTQVYVAFVMKYTQTTTGISGDRWLLDNVRVSEQCLNPTGLVATGVLFNQASLSWANPSGATSWEIEVIPATATPTGVGIVYNGTLPYVATGLTPNTAYKYYVRAICLDNIPSEWVGPTTFSTTTAPPVCGGNYLDPGGTGNYADNITAATGTTTICPVNATDLVTVTFTSFSTEGCCDFLSIYNGNSSSAPLIGTFSGTTSPGIITSTVPGGCLTFVFTTDGSVVSSGWVANVTCAPPPTCPKPTALATSAITSNSGTLAFTNNSSATNFEYLAVPCGSPAPTNGATGTVGIATTSNPIVITGLTPNTCYTLYVRAVCAGSDYSDWSVGVNITTLVAPPVCGGNFVDSGGITGNYANNADSVVTICPVNVGDVVTVTFTAFNTQANNDGLYIFNGNSITSPLISSGNPAGAVPGGLAGAFWGTVSPGTITSSSSDGCLTFRFRSNGTTTATGWASNVTCAPPVACPSPIALSSSNLLHNSVNLSWNEMGTATSWQILALPCGSPAPTAASIGFITASSNPFILTGLTPLTCYDIYIRSNCSTSTSTWSGPRTITTLVAPPVCGGTFLDPGGTGNYANNITATTGTTVICPVNATDLVTVTFTSFSTEGCCDFLSIYNGSSSSAPLIGTFGGTNSPGIITSTVPGGCLTFVFTTDSSVVSSGWVANVTCAPPPTCPKPTALATSAITSNSGTLAFTNNSSATNFEYLAVPCGSPAPTNGATGTVGTGTTSNPIVITGLTPNTCYTLYVRAVCDGSDYSDWSVGVNITTQVAPPVCGGNFVDSGGITGNYVNNADSVVTICPVNVGDVVTVTFTAFNTQANNDGLYIFNGNSITSPLISSGNPAGAVPGGLAGSFWGTVSPGTITSSSPDGCLTFRFRSNGTTTSTGWMSNVTCAPPVACPSPIALSSSNVLHNSVNLSWNEMGTATSWQILALPCGSPAPTAASTGFTNASSNPFVLTGLTPLTCYDIYIRSNCSTSTSTWTGPRTITTLVAPPVCGGTFLDPGGTGNYANSITAATGTTVICPVNATDLVTVTFTSFSTEGCCDFLSIYNGSSSSAPLIGTFGGTNSPGEITSTVPGGCLTFVFTTDSSVVSSGWVANVTCAPPPTCPRPTALVASATTSNSTTVSFTNNSTATSFEYIALPCGSPAPTNGTTGTSGIAFGTNPIVITGLTPATCYTIYVRAICAGNDNSNWSVGINVTTLVAPPVCGGTFLDPGGIGNYANNITAATGTTVICPTNATDLVTVTFTSFSTEGCCDFLSIYDGNSTSAPLIGTFGGTNSPGEITSSAPGGCLTFVFTTDGSVVSSGWVANIVCAPAPTCPRPTALSFSTTTSNSTTLSFTNNSTATNFEYIALPCGSPAPTNGATGTSGIAATTNPILITGLTPNTCYTVYVRAVCAGNDFSNWSVGANVTTQLAPPVCGGNYFDPGLLSNYSNNSNIATLICPTNTGDKVTITFTSFSTEEGFDVLSVYNGNSASAPLIGSFSGTTLPDSITSSAANGCLYFVFISNGTNVSSGWSSNITCAPPVSCPKPLGFTSTPVITDSTQLNWIEAGSATSWQILVQPCGTPNPTASSTGWITVSSSPYTITGLTPNCCNEYFIRSVCGGSATSDWTRVYNNEDGAYIVWADGPGNTLIGTYPGGTVTATFTGTGNTPTINPIGNPVNLDTSGTTTFETFGPTSNPPSQDLTFTFSTPVIISRYTMADIDLGDFGWNDTFNFVGVTFTSTTSANLLTTTTGAVATSDVSGNGEYGNWFMSTTPVTSFSLDYSVTNNLTHAYLSYAMKVFIPCPPITPPSLTVSVNSPIQCQGTTATVTATPNTAGTYNYVWTVPAGVTNPGNVASFTTTTGGNYSVVITSTSTSATASGSGIVTFNPIVTPTFTAISPICQNNVAPTLPLTSNNGISGTWNPATINTAIVGTTTYTFTPNTTIVGQECAIPTTLNITIVNPTVPTFTQVLPICSGTTLSALPTTSNNGVIGTWSPALNNSATTTYTFTPNSGLCATTTTMQIQVNVCDLNIYASAVWMQDCTTTGDGKFFNTNGAGTDLINPDGSNFAINYGVHVQNSATLLLRGAEIKTQKSGSSNICDARMNYRVFPTSSTPGAFTPWNLPFYSDCNTTSGVFNVGGGTCVTGQQKWQCVSQAGCTPPLDLTTFAPGNYTIQVYYDINGSLTTTTGCTDNLVLNNGGNYYVANFTIQAPATVSSTNPTTCSGTDGTVTISNLAANATYSITYSDDTVVTSPASYTSDASGNIVISGLNSGVYTNFSMTINNCTTNLSNLVILTDPALPSVSVNNSSICSTGTATVTATPITSGTYNYSWTVPATATNPGNVNSFTTQVGGLYSVIITNTTTNCSSSSANGIVTILPDVTMELGSANNVQTVCINTPISSIIYTTTNGVTDVTSSGLPSGVTGTFNSGIYTITGIPTVSGTYNYSVTTSGGCGSVTLNGTITVSPNVTINLTSGSSTQSVCVNTAIATIEYTTANGATNVTSSGLPLGVTGTFNSGIYTITGTPTISGTYNYTVTTSGGCSSVTLNGTITVSPNATLNLTSGNNIQNICINTAIATIEYTAGSGVTNVTSSGLPSGVTGTFNSGIYTITGIATVAGTYNYSVTASSGCSSVTLNGTITVSPNVTMNLTSGSSIQSVCINTPITTIGYTTGNGATNVTASGLPSGVTGVYNSGIFTITGTPTVAGTYNYTVTTSGGCSSVTLSGTITVNSLTLPIFTFGTATTICQNGPVEILVGTSSNGFIGTWSPSVISNTTSGIYTFTPNAGQCASTTTYTVTVQSAFDFEFESGCIGDNFTLQANPIENGYDENTATYSWVYNSNVVGTDESFDVTSYLLSTSVNEALPITFYLTITRADGCSTTKPIDVTNVYCGIQKGISPNNDTLNDSFDLTLLNVDKLEIYNRYGMKVYAKSNYVDEWKGQSDKGDDLPDGTYYYVIQFKNNQPTKTGWIYINREY